MKKFISLLFCVLFLLFGCTSQADQTETNPTTDRGENIHNHTPAEKRQADSFMVHAEVAEITEYIICYQEPDGCITSVAAMGHYEQSFMIHNNLIYFVELGVPYKICAIDFSGNVQKECVLNAHKGWILYSDENYLYGAAGDLGNNADYIFQADWNLTECKQIDAFPKQFRQFDYEKVGKDFAELCQANISKIYVHGANVLFDANGMAYEMSFRVSAVADSETISGNLLLGWYNQHPSYDTVTMNPWFNKVDEDYGSTEGLMTLDDFLAQLKDIEDSSVIPENLPAGTKPFRLAYGTGAPDKLPIAQNAVKVYMELTNGTPNTIAQPDTSKDYFSIVSKNDNAIIGILNVSVASQKQEINSSKTESSEQISGTKIFVYEGIGFGGGNFHIKIHDDGTFTYQQGSASNYYGVGKWSLQGDVLCMEDDISSYTFVNYFKVVENTLVFQAENSTNFMYVHLSDGEKFVERDNL